MALQPVDPALALLTGVNLLFIFAAVAAVSLLIGVVARRRGGGSGARKAGSLWLRMLTFAVLAPASLLPAMTGGWLLAAFVCLFAAVCSLELWGLVEERLPASGVAGVLLSLLVPAAATAYGPAAVATAALVLAAATAIPRAFAGRSAVARRLSVSSAIALYASLLLSALILIRKGPAGAGGLVFTLLVVEIADVGAMLGGLLFGRTPLAPRLSPGKTAEGFAAGVFAAMCVGLLFRRALPLFPLAAVLVDSALLAACGLLGDLLASALKRRAGRKDFGKVLPGHGGFMDRADSMLVAGPAAWMLLGSPPAAGPFPQRAAAYAAVAAWGLAAFIAIRILFVRAKRQALP